MKYQQFYTPHSGVMVNKMVYRLWDHTKKVIKEMNFISC